MAGGRDGDGGGEGSVRAGAVECAATATAATAVHREGGLQGRRGGCTGHCCINRFGELGVATPEGTAHVRIDYTHLFPAFNSLFLSLSLSSSLFLLRPLTSRASSRFSAIGRWLRFSLSYNTSLSLFLTPSEVSLSFSVSPSFARIVLFLFFFSIAFSLGFTPRTTLVRAQRTLSPRGAHGARRSVIFKPFAL